MIVIKSKSLLIAACLVILFGVLLVLPLVRRGKVIESWQTGNKTFTIRVTARSERLALPGLGGTYYAFESNTVGWMYGVTSDAGTTWSVWNADRDLPGWKCCDYNFIRDVRIAPNGIGTMQVSSIGEGQGDVAELHTTDYGRHWTAE